jgi:hypothetical protein
MIGPVKKHKRSHRGRTNVAASLAILAVAGALLTGTAQSSAANRQPAARAARTLNGTGTAHLHLVRAEGSQLFEEGRISSGPLKGTMQAELNLGATFTGSFTFHTSAGSIKGHGKATPHGSGRYLSFSGSLVVTGGSGRYTHVKGHGGLYGVFDRQTDAVIVQTTGTLTY